MPVRIRLQRHGKKGKPFYWIVAADSRAKRDGRYLEKIGTYNPNTNPAAVELNLDQAVKWLEYGAQPSDTARTLLSYRGAMIKHHLNGGVRKGAFSQEEADKRFTFWLEEKQAKIQAKIDSLDKNKAIDLAKRLESEKAVNQKRIADLKSVLEAGKVEKSAKDIAVDDEPDDSETTTKDEIAIEEAAAPESVVEEENIAEEAAAPESDVKEETIAEEASASEAALEEVTTDEEVPNEAPKTEEVASTDKTKSEDAATELEETKE